MRQILIFAVVAAHRRRLCRALRRQDGGRKRRRTRPRPAAGRRSRARPRPASIRWMLTGGRDGHFQVDARVDGRQIDFMVDTGASLVILRETDAANVGMHPMPRDYTAIVSTANGKIKAAPAKLDARRDRRHHRLRRAGAGAAGRGAGDRICSASRSCRGCGATNMPTAAWCSSSRLPAHRQS